ncbi:MAG: phosphoribosylformylglycinamidine synthase subunit PurS [Candidatus Kapabacteria bacterium]|jgi:phosphoribosylformylglycinamidine synthase PurS subunit|nr:phosphoribosylformylglycinamidine synthase subunit PurS [Candidatus Kapabacteria bacterium]
MNNYKAQINITLRAGILDVQGKTVEHALHSIDYPMISQLRIGKFVEMNVEADNSGAAAKLADEACKKLIANPIIEDYKITVSESE